jgi:hypothetical protein
LVNTPLITGEQLSLLLRNILPSVEHISIRGAELLGPPLLLSAMCFGVQRSARQLTAPLLHNPNSQHMEKDVTRLLEAYPFLHRLCLVLPGSRDEAADLAAEHQVVLSKRGFRLQPDFSAAHVIGYDVATSDTRGVWNKETHGYDGSLELDSDQDW